jgi:hypothetical protein
MEFSLFSTSTWYTVRKSQTNTIEESGDGDGAGDGDGYGYGSFCRVFWTQLWVEKLC